MENEQFSVLCLKLTLTMLRTLFIFVFLLCLPLLIFAQAKTSQKVDDTPTPVIFTYVEQMPQFPDDLNTFIIDNLRYPADAVASKIQGKVYLRFVVDESGTVGDITVTKSASPMLTEEAVRVVKSMPKWKPGMQNGNPVSVYLTLPVSFRL